MIIPGSSALKLRFAVRERQPAGLVVAVRNYYRVLGIPQSESAQGVRAAFRALVKRFHPDCAATGSAERFREIHEAYAVLSDPRRRGEYDSRFSSEGRPAARRDERDRRAAEPMRRVEPLVPKRQAPPRHTPMSRDASSAAQRRVLRAEVLMTPSEASHGGVATLRVPLAHPCPACAGSGGFGPLSCELCSASGVVRGERTISIRLPPMASARASYDVVVDALLGLVLHLDVRVATS